MEVLKAVEFVNERQKRVLFDKLTQVFPLEDLKGKTIALWGLAFKPETDDMRESTALVMIDLLLKAGCRLRVYDPIAMDECKRRMTLRDERTSSGEQAIERIFYARDMYEAVLDADALLLLTEWKEFRLPSWEVVRKTMNGNLVIDGRNIYDAGELTELGFEYHCIGR